MMTADEVRTMVETIDRTVRKMPWIDFEVKHYLGNELIIMGSLDSSASRDIEIIFMDVFFVSMPIAWKTDTSKTVLTLVNGEATVVINKRFQVEQGHHIFRFMPEYYADDFYCLVAAKTITWRALISSE